MRDEKTNRANRNPDLPTSASPNPPQGGSRRVCEVAITTSWALFIAAGCGEPRPEDAADASPAAGGKADEDEVELTLIKPSRCDVVCGTHPSYSALVDLYCNGTVGAFPSWLNPFSVELHSEEPPVPEFVAYSLVGDENLTLGGEGWVPLDAEEHRAMSTQPLANSPDTNPNKWGLDSLSPRFFASAAGVRDGLWAAWPLRISAEDSGAPWSVYVYVPPGATKTAVRYRIYNGIESSPATQHVVDQTDHRGAEITLFGQDYVAPGWHFLGNTRLYEGASVSAEPDSEEGVAFVDTVLAVRWGCADEY